MSYKKSIRNIMYFNFFNNCSFERVLWIAYLVSKDISLIKIGIIQSVLNIAMSCFEVPTGVVADKYGRKVSLFIGNFLILFYLLIFLLSNTFSYFLIGVVIYALGLTFISGSGEALIYDNLKGLNLEKKYDSILGKINFVSYIGLVFSILFGGVLESQSYKLIFIVGIIFRLLCALSILKINEIKEIKDFSENDVEINLFTFFKKYKVIVLYLISSSMFVGLFSIYDVLGQQILSINGETNLMKVSIIFSVLYLSSSGISLIYSKLKKFFSIDKLLIINGIIMISLLILTLDERMKAYYYIPFILIGSLFEINAMSFDIIINKITLSRIRATTFSIYSLITTGFMSVFSILITYFLKESYSFNYNFFILSLLVIGLSTIIFLFLIKRHYKNMFCKI